MSALNWLPELLLRRHWGLVLAALSAPDFITGDSPTSIQWTDPQMEGHGGAGLGYRDTEVAIALHRRLAVIGRLEHVEPLQEADLITIANINGRTAGNASRYLYAASDDFVFMNRSGELLSADKWFHSRAHLSRS